LKAKTPGQLKDVRHWAYQIQGLEMAGAAEALVQSRYDLLVIEPTNTIQGYSDFDTAGLVRWLHSTEGSRAGVGKLAIAYINIGEAEDYRDYWAGDWIAPTTRRAGTPDFMIRPDPDGWAGNYPVAYWDERWKSILIYGPNSLLQRALDAGFDGIYMDWVEAYADERGAAEARAAGIDPVQAMVDLIREKRDYARARRPGFLIIPQNASELAALQPEYLGLIDAIAQEHLYFDGDSGTIASDANSGDVRMPATGEDSTEYYEQRLQPYLAAGKRVFCVDYAQKPQNVTEAYERAAARGFVPYVTLRALSELTNTPPPGYGEN
jgi:cysteinyl-tRNA synthetase